VTVVFSVFRTMFPVRVFIDKRKAGRAQEKISFFDMNFSKGDKAKKRRSAMSELETWVLASHNAGKIRELQDKLLPYGVALKGADAFGLGDVEETESSFEGNAALKAEAACRETGRPALADDSGLAVDALDGAPGVHSARWAIPEPGAARDFSYAMKKVQDGIETVGGPAGARFVSVLALARPGRETVFFRGEVKGEIVWPPRGSGGFGYDPIFKPEGWAQTFAEAPAEAKQGVSHRSRALQALIAAEFTGAE
jgi:XTP/dITP diphosphohydrolase